MTLTSATADIAATRIGLSNGRGCSFRRAENDGGIVERSAIASEPLSANSPVSHDGFDHNEMVTLIANDQKIVVNHRKLASLGYAPSAIDEGVARDAEDRNITPR